MCDETGSKRRDDAVLHALDADAVSRWYRGGLAALDATREEINSLNVFPVADADTGTNLHLTLESAVRGPDGETPAGISPVDSTDLAETALSMARLSLLGARGSSGVILSQLLRGVAEVLASERLPPRGLGLTRALERAVALAYAAVSHPVEGTMLSVARAAAEAARATGSDDLATVVGAAVEAARRALDRTPEQLDVLRRAGVVDAGGRGVVVLLEVLQAVIDERPLPVWRPSIAHPRLDVDSTAGPTPAYEVMYLVDARDERITELRDGLDRIGDSVVVSGGGGLWTVHVHTDDAGAAVEAGTAVGHPHRIRLSAITENDHPSTVANAAVPDPNADADASVSAVTHAVAVLVPAGSPTCALRSVFADAGVQLIEVRDSPGDQVSGLRADRVVLLAESRSGRDLAESRSARDLAESRSARDDVTADHAAAVRAAEKALAAAGVDVRVVCARSAVQLLAAVAVHDPHRPFDADVVAMAGAAAATRHAAVRADPSEDGRFIGIADGEPPAVGDDPGEVAIALLEQLLTDDVEMVTVVATSQLCDQIAARVFDLHGGLNVVAVPIDLPSTVWLGVE